MLLTKKQLLTHNTASKDDARPILTQIYAYRDGDEIVAVSTDSYVLSEVRQQHTPPTNEFPNLVPDVDNPDIDECMLDAQAAKRIVPLLPKKPLLPILSHALVHKQGLATTDLDKTVSITSHPVEGKFPDYKKLMPAAATLQISLNPAKLRQALELFKGDDDINMTIEFGKTKMDPVVLRSSHGGTKTTVLVMPLRA